PLKYFAFLVNVRAILAYFFHYYSISEKSDDIQAMLGSDCLARWQSLQILCCHLQIEVPGIHKLISRQAHAKECHHQARSLQQLHAIDSIYRFHYDRLDRYARLDRAVSSRDRVTDG